MIRLYDGKVRLENGKPVRLPEAQNNKNEDKIALTMAYQILLSHNHIEEDDSFHIGFDCLVSHDITYVGIIQSARMSGMKEFPIPYAMTNCHNSLCAVGGTINEDDHIFGLSAAKKYGGIYVPANQSVIHMYAREEMSGVGKMILGSDSHTRYGALGTMGIGEGGPELVKQLLKHSYDVKKPEVVLVYISGTPRRGVGPHDVALALVKATFPNGFVKNKILEFVGPGIKNLSIDFRNGIDVMTTETTCLSSIWETDEKTAQYYETQGRREDFHELHPINGAEYDKMVEIDLDKVEPMIALPFHPSNAFTIEEFNSNSKELLANVEKDASNRFEGLKLDLLSKIRDGKVWADQGIIAGCSGGIFENICEASSILNGKYCPEPGFSFSVYPGSMPVEVELAKNGVLSKLIASGAVIKPAFCGPCFGAGDVPANNGFSIRHTTRNFPNREGSKPGQGQLSCVALMDARSIAVSALNGGAITSALSLNYVPGGEVYHYDKSIYEKRTYNGFGNPKPEVELIKGPNITDWPKFYPLQDNLLFRLAAVIQDDVTTTDELIPSGDTSSYRSNPLKLAEFALSRRVPEYVEKSKATALLESQRRDGKSLPEELLSVISKVSDKPEDTLKKTSFGSGIFAKKPGDGSAREQAASCQKVLGGTANICYEYATKRYRSNCINWGLIPFTITKDTPFNYETGAYVFIPNVKNALKEGVTNIEAKIIDNEGIHEITLKMEDLSTEERTILLEGCLMNYYSSKNK